MNENNLRYETSEKSLIDAVKYRQWNELEKKIVGSNESWSDVINKNSELLEWLKKNKSYFRKWLENNGYDPDEYSFMQVFEDEKKLEQEDYIENNKEKFVSQSPTMFIQPILGVKYIGKQQLASRQVMKNNMSLVLDEVGTGKTVAALYSMQNVINECIQESKNCQILVLCPFMKKNDWKADIAEQLGRVAEIANRYGWVDDIVPFNILIVANDSKNLIYDWIKKYRNWNLIIIDECHRKPDNYTEWNIIGDHKKYIGLKGDKTILLTATPITNNKLLDDYYKLMNEIVYGDCYEYDSKECNKINPLERFNTIKNISTETELFSENDVYVCHFKEDFFDVSINRRILFLPCKRDEKRKIWFKFIQIVKGYFMAIYNAQDDELLLKTYNKLSNSNEKIERNYKLEKLHNIIQFGKARDESGKEIEIGSAIIFCQTKAAVKKIFDNLKDIDGINLGAICSGFSYYYDGRNQQKMDKNIVMTKLKNSIKYKDNKKSVLVITGKTGGVGLNLGEFNTVIHYELPFTSNDLEQRFGRIERADEIISKINDKNNEINNTMIFLTNEDGDNRMLDYCIHKIKSTFRYIPVRNTVLFTPENIERELNDAQEIMSKLINTDRGIYYEAAKCVLKYTHSLKEEKFEEDDYNKYIKSLVNEYSISKKMMIINLYQNRRTGELFKENCEITKEDIDKIYEMVENTEVFQAIENYDETIWDAVVKYISLSDMEIMLGYSPITEKKIEEEYEDDVLDEGEGDVLDEDELLEENKDDKDDSDDSDDESGNSSYSDIGYESKCKKTFSEWIIDWVKNEIEYEYYYSLSNLADELKKKKENIQKASGIFWYDKDNERIRHI